MPGDDKYTYPGSGGVLKNLLDITNAETLDDATNAFVSVEWAALLEEPTPDEIDSQYLTGIHERFFRRIFDWAGQIRDVELIASGTGFVYCPYEAIGERLATAFEQLAADDYLHGLDAIQFTQALARTWAELTYIHPFRDGNTRSQSFLVSRLAEAAGHPINWETVQPARLRMQRIAAVQGHPEALAFYLEDHLIDPPDHW